MKPSQVQAIWFECLKNRRPPTPIDDRSEHSCAPTSRICIPEHIWNETVADNFLRKFVMNEPFQILACVEMETCSAVS